MGASTWQANEWLDAVGAVWVAPCDGDPDPSQGGTAVVAPVLVEFGPATGGRRENSDIEVWESMPSSTVTHMAFFDAETGGNYRGSAVVPSYDPDTETGGDVVSSGQRYRAAAGTIVMEVA